MEKFKSKFKFKWIFTQSIVHVENAVLLKITFWHLTKSFIATYSVNTFLHNGNKHWKYWVIIPMLAWICAAFQCLRADGRLQSSLLLAIFLQLVLHSVCTWHAHSEPSPPSSALFPPTFSSQNRNRRAVNSVHALAVRSYKDEWAKSWPIT